MQMDTSSRNANRRVVDRKKNGTLMREMKSFNGLLNEP